jgi:nucleotide-binding universal stress UspA family protein
MIKRILVGLAGTEYTPVAIRYAVELASRDGAELTGVTVIDVTRLENIGPIPLGGSQQARELREHRFAVAREHVEQAVLQFETACQEAGLKHSIHHEESEPFSQIIALARYHDLKIFGLKGLVDHDIVEEPQDTMIKLVTSGVRPILAVGTEHREVRRVLVAYSGSTDSAKTFKRFAQMHLWPDVTVRVVHFSETADDGPALVHDAAEYFRAHEYQVEEDCVEDSPKTRLLPYAAEWDADLIVAGNSSRKLLLRRVFGETARILIQDSDRPLFLSQ